MASDPRRMWSALCCGTVCLAITVLAGCKGGETPGSTQPKQVGPDKGEAEEGEADEGRAERLSVEVVGDETLVLRPVAHPFSIQGNTIAYGENDACHVVMKLDSGDRERLPCEQKLTLPLARLHPDFLISFSAFDSGQVYARGEYGKPLGDFDVQAFAGATDRHLLLRRGKSVIGAHPLATPSDLAWEVDLAGKKFLPIPAGILWMDDNVPSTSFGIVDGKGEIKKLGPAEGNAERLESWEHCPTIFAATWGRRPGRRYEFFDGLTGVHLHGADEKGLISDLACNDQSFGYLVWNSLGPSALVMVDRRTGKAQRSDLPERAGYNGKAVMADVLVHPAGDTLHTFVADAPATSSKLPLPMADQLHGAEISLTHGRLLWSARQIFQASDGADPTTPRIAVYDLKREELIFDEEYDLDYDRIGPVELWSTADGDDMWVVLQSRLHHFRVGATSE